MGTKPSLMVEVLSPDFSGSEEGVRAVASSGLDVFAHNIETVERLTPAVRDPRAKYRQTLEVLRKAGPLVRSSSRRASSSSRIFLRKEEVKLKAAAESRENLCTL